MKIRLRLNQKGITLIELLVALVIFGLVVAGIYRFLIAQSKAYSIQDQVVEVQQNIRGAMESLLRDLRMAGFDNDSIHSKVNVLTPIVTGENTVTVDYEYDYTHRYSVSYWVDGNARLIRRLTVIPDVGPSTTTQESILENLEVLQFTYGVDDNDDNLVDYWTSVMNMGKVVAIRVVLSARPDLVNPEVNQQISPRTLTSVITLRNLCLNR
jgi:type IV pilus assembly protein PilW